LHYVGQLYRILLVISDDIMEQVSMMLLRYCITCSDKLRFVMDFKMFFFVVYLSSNSSNSSFIKLIEIHKR